MSLKDGRTEWIELSDYNTAFACNASRGKNRIDIDSLGKSVRIDCSRE